MPSILRSLVSFLCLASAAFAAEPIAHWSFTGRPEGQSLGAVLSTGARAVGFQAVPSAYAVVDGCLRLSASGEHETYTPPLTLPPAAYLLELDLAAWEAQSHRVTVHYGFTANLNKVVSADITLEAGPEGLRVFGRALGGSAQNTPVLTLPATGADTTLRLLVNFATREMELSHRAGADASAPFVSVGKGALAPARPATAIRLRTTGNLNNDTVRIRALSVLQP